MRPDRRIRETDHCVGTSRALLQMIRFCAHAGQRAVAADSEAQVFGLAPACSWCHYADDRMIRSGLVPGAIFGCPLRSARVGPAAREVDVG